MKLTNFYKDYVFNPDDFDEIKNMLSATTEKINEYLLQLNDLRIGGELEDFRIMPVQYINITPALYDTGAVFDSEELRVWNNGSTSLSEKLDMLYSKGKYIRLVADRGFANDAAEEHKVIDFKLYDPLGRRMVHNIDYVYKNNILYILDYSDWDTRNGVFFKMTDVAIDLNTVDDVLGKNLKLSYDQSKISKSEFNKIVRKLTVSAVKGSLVSAIKESVAQLDDSGSDSVLVVDKMTTDKELGTLWQNIFANRDSEAGLEIRSGSLSPFDFLIYYPIYFGDYKVKLLKEYLDKVKHAYTSYAEFAYEPTHLENYDISKILYEWVDDDLKPDVEDDTFSFLDEEDEIFYICSAELYYYDRAAGEPIDLLKAEDGKGPFEVLDSSGVWIRTEELSKEIQEDDSDYYIEAQEKSTLENRTADDIDSNSEESLYVHYALIGYELSHTGYNMILY